MNDDNDRILSFEEICAANDLETQDIHVPEWNGSVRLQTLSGDQRDSYVQLLQGRMVGTGKGRRLNNYKNLTAMLLQMCLVKNDGSPLFDAKQVNKLQAKNGDVINRLTEAAQRMNGLTDDEVAKQAGNSETGPSAESGTSLPPDSDAQLAKLGDE